VNKGGKKRGKKKKKEWVKEEGQNGKQCCM
jgi:hypothetical protein